MALVTLQVTIGAAATQITTTRKSVRQLIFSPTAHDYYVGKSNVDSTHGVKVPVPAANVPYQFLHIGPFSGDGPSQSTEFYVSGTQNDVVQIILITQ
jgi:hypothetical protein